MKRLLLILIGISVAAILSEVFLRYFYPQITISSFIAPYDFPCYINGEYLYQRMIPNKTCILKSNYNAFSDISIRTNSLGLRNDEITQERPKDTKRLLFLGDSFTMGAGVEQEKAYPQVVENNLKKQSPGVKVQTINAGINGTGPVYQFVYYKHDGISLNPNVVVVGFLPWNDITTDIHDSEMITKFDTNGFADRVESRSAYVDSDGYLRQKNLPLRFKVPFVRSSQVVNLVLNAFQPFDSSGLRYDSDMVFCMFKTECKELEESKETAKKIFLDFKKLTKSANSQLLVLLIPAEFQIYDTVAGKYFTNPKAILLPTEKRKIHTELGEFFRQNAIDYLDLLPVFWEHQNEKTYLDKDYHWNKRGHEIAAEVISQKLDSMLLTR